ncbi:amphi-Trp domain-containing protein [Pseudodesulfovibrio tunisiensis]|uniref:amphi-Trp domain-containing protein n=1 Tax=Pseudodesulfovibrio tunisiensis TaxID=463192 RepID=UPI001FB3E975|nr:amphi-Trp domain-containing protein [Pseudodesulfovibrio tunisiensis]
MGRNKVRDARELGRAEVAAFLRELAASLEGGEVVLAGKDRELRFGVSETVELEVKARTRKDKARYAVSLSWKLPGDALVERRAATPPATRKKAAPPARKVKADPPAEKVEAAPPAKKASAERKPAGKVAAEKASAGKADGKRTATKKGCASKIEARCEKAGCEKDGIRRQVT